MAYSATAYCIITARHKNLIIKLIINNIVKIAQFGKDSCRSIGEKLGLSKSSVNRSQQKINMRSHICNVSL